jgi:hypothetical protein
MHTYVNPKNILKKLKLSMPVPALTLVDPMTDQPIVIEYDDLHSLIVFGSGANTVDWQVNSNLYAEMARYQRAAELGAKKATKQYAMWKSAMADELRAQRKAAAKGTEAKAAKGTKAAPSAKAPTGNEIESYYRAHEEYEARSSEPDRMQAIADLFGDLKMAFKMKAEAMRELGRTVSGFEGTSRAEEDTAAAIPHEDLDDELVSEARQNGSLDAWERIVSGKANEAPPLPPPAPAKPPKAPRSLD